MSNIRTALKYMNQNYVNIAHIKTFFIKLLQNVSRILSDSTGMINLNPVISQNYYIILKKIIILVPIY